MAAASLDVVVSVSLFGVFLGLAFSAGKYYLYVNYHSNAATMEPLFNTNSSVKINSNSP